MPRLLIALLVGLTLAGGAPAADNVCRSNALGSVTCPGADRPPPPRPIYRKPAQALDRVRAAPEAADPYPGFVPARDTERLGGTVTTAPVGGGLCRPDTLGNLRCP